MVRCTSCISPINESIKTCWLFPQQLEVLCLFMCLGIYASISVYVYVPLFASNIVCAFLKNNLALVYLFLILFLCLSVSICLCVLICRLFCHKFCLFYLCFLVRVYICISYICVFLTLDGLSPFRRKSAQLNKIGQRQAKQTERFLG